MPYAPGITFDASPIAKGISDLGKGLGDAISNYRNNKKESQYLDSQFELLAPSLASVTDPNELPSLAKFSSMSLSQKRGALAGAMYRADQARQTQDLKLRELAANTNRDYMLAQTEGIRSNQQRLKLADEAQAGFGRDLNLFGAMNPENPPLVLDPALRRQLQEPGGALTLAAARNPLAPSAQNVLGDALPALARQRGNLNLSELTFAEDPVSGTRFARSGNSILPSGVNPEKASKVTAVTDADGKVVGQMDSRGRIVKTGSAISDALKVFGERRKLGSQLADVLKSEMLASTPEQKAKIQEQISRIGAMESELEKLVSGGSNAPKQPADDAELANARAALAAGRPRAQVQAMYKQRTGRDLPE